MMPCWDAVKASTPAAQGTGAEWDRSGTIGVRLPWYAPGHPRRMPLLRPTLAPTAPYAPIRPRPAPARAR